MNRKLVIEEAIHVILSLYATYTAQCMDILSIITFGKDNELPAHLKRYAVNVDNVVINLNKLISEYSECSVCRGKGIIPDDSYPREGYNYIDCPECKEGHNADNLL